jgi:hypothetical protein
VNWADDAFDSRLVGKSESWPGAAPYGLQGADFLLAPWARRTSQAQPAHLELIVQGRVPHPTVYRVRIFSWLHGCVEPPKLNPPILSSLFKAAPIAYGWSAKAEKNSSPLETMQCI